MEPYAPRRIQFVTVRKSGAWRLKLYSVVYGSDAVDWDGFEPGLRQAEDELPGVDAAKGRPGLGFLIAHHGRTGDYVVLCWWDHENELPIGIWVRRAPDQAWRPARDGESICVWDLEIVWAERNAWVKTMMVAGRPDPAAYLASVEVRHH